MDPDPAERMHHVLYARHSARAPFDPAWRVTPRELAHLVEAARWAPTPHDMQNFELVVVEDPAVLATLGGIEVPVSPLFIAESYRPLSWTAEELEVVDPVQVAGDEGRLLGELIAGAPMLIFVIFDGTARAPASEHDELGMIGLGCILENMWLIAQTLHLDLQVVSSVASPEVEPQVKAVLAIPPPWRIAYTLRIGHANAPATAPHIRRDVPRFVHRDHFAK